MSKYEADPGAYTVVDDGGKPVAKPETGASGSGGGSGAGGGSEPPVVIPDDWSALHHMTKIALAEQIIGKDIEPVDGKTKTQLAEDIISAEVAKRKAA
jgi:hypothetical protein